MKALLFFVYIITILAYLPYYVLKAKRSVHMLQQNSYRNERFKRWMNNNPNKVINKKEFLPLLAIIPFFLEWYLFGLVIYLLAMLFVFTARTHETQKLKLALTPRVKRLFATIAVLNVIVFVVFYFLLLTNWEEMMLGLFFVVLTCIVIGQYYITMLANIINQPIEKGINQYYFNDAENKIQALSHLKVVGITGSYGKTSVKHIVGTVLGSQYTTLITPESYNTKLGVTITIRKFLQPIHEVFVAEMGAKQKNDIQEICDLVHPKYGIITAIGPQHLETFGSLENVQKTKYELIDSLPEDGIGFLNYDDENIRSYQTKSLCKIIRYGIEHEDLHYRATNLHYDEKGSTFTVEKYDGTSVQIQSKLLGKHNIYNMLSAIAVASEFGMSLDKIALAIKKVKPVAHRLELKKREDGVTVIDNAFNSNPEGSKMSLDVLSKMPGKKILVTPGMIELGEKEYELNKAFGTYAAEVCDYVILVGKKQTLPIQDGLKEVGFDDNKWFVANDLYHAMDHLSTVVEKGSFVLFENDLPDTFNE